MEYFGFSLAGAHPTLSHVDVVGDLLNCVELADKLGLNGWFFAEHHVDPSFSLTPSPNLLIATAARRTTRLRLGNMVNILPFHHPLRVAEEIRMLDLLTDGRLEVGFGRGQVRGEQAAFGTERNATVDMFDEAFDIVQRLLKGETVDYKSPWWAGRSAQVIPEATQTPTPPMWLSAASDTSVEKAARLGLHCATALLPRKTADARLKQFHRDWDRHNPDRIGQGKFAIVANIAIADTLAEACAQVQFEFDQKQAHFARSITDTPGSDDRTYLSHRPNYEAFANASFDDLLANHLLIAGTVDDCRRQVAEIRDRGIDVLICNFHNVQTDLKISRRALELFASEVIPVVEGASKPPMSTRSSNDTRRVPLNMSHIGIYVKDLPLMEDFYTRVLGFTVTDRGDLRDGKIVFTSWNPKDHHQVALVSGRPKDHAFNHINQISFRVASVEDLQLVWWRVKAEQHVTDLRPTNHGNAWSVYFRDPEGNRLEVFCDTDWYIEQPCIEDLDLSLPADQIRANSEAFCRRSPGFKPIEQFQAELATKLGVTM